MENHTPLVPYSFLDTPVQQGGPPMASIAEQAHAQGALLDLDKHDWPWSMALVPIMEVDLFELSNNHLWRTSFAFKQWSAPKAPYMSFAQDPQSGNEDAWDDVWILKPTTPCSIAGSTCDQQRHSQRCLWVLGGFTFTWRVLSPSINGSRAWI